MSDIERKKIWAEFQNNSARLGAERTNLLSDLQNRILNEGSKGLVLINGGGAVALAAFLQAIWDKDAAAPMRLWVLVGICWLLVGTALAALIFVTRYLGSFDDRNIQPNAKRWWRSQMVLTIASVLFFLIGMGFAVAGGFVALWTH